MFPIDPKIVLANKINALGKFPVKLTPADLDYGIPSTFIIGDCNTKITVSAKATSPYFTGSYLLYYTRYRLPLYFNGLSIPGKPGDYTTTQTALQAFINKYGLPFDPYQFHLDLVDPAATSITFTPSNTNLMFISGIGTSLPFDNK